MTHTLEGCLSGAGSSHLEQKVDLKLDRSFEEKQVYRPLCPGTTSTDAVPEGSCSPVAQLRAV